MCKDACIVVFDDSESSPDMPAHDSELVELELNIFGNSLHLYIAVGNKPVRLSMLVPLARLLNTRITTIIKEYVINNGGTVTCQAKCSQCCRYLIPVAIPEAIRLSEEVMQMSKWKQKLVYKSTTLVAKRILELTPKDFLQELAEVQSETGSELNEISKWYSSMNLPCPFLFNNMCTIYNRRPMVCREHLAVNSVPDFCKPGNTKQAQLSQTPFSIAEALAELTSELEQKPVETIMLPFVFAWYDRNYGCFEHTWPASELVRRFVEILSSQNRESYPYPLSEQKVGADMEDFPPHAIKVETKGSGDQSANSYTVHIRGVR